jgi:hypothetical protein
MVADVELAAINQFQTSKRMSCMFRSITINFGSAVQPLKLPLGREYSLLAAKKLSHPFSMLELSPEGHSGIVQHP